MSKNESSEINSIQIFWRSVIHYIINIINSPSVLDLNFPKAVELSLIGILEDAKGIEESQLHILEK